MQTRRRKQPANVPAESRDLEVTTVKAPDATEERWDGDPNEEPPAAPVSQVPQAPAYPKPWGEVIQRVFDLDVNATLQRLEKELSLGDGATEYGTVLHAQDKSARNLYDASRLCRAAKVQEADFGAQLDRELEVLRTAAAKSLEIEKANGQRAKAATIQDIDDRMLATWPDKVRALKKRKEELHGASRAFEGLIAAWQERCRTLRSMAEQFKSSGA